MRQGISQTQQVNFSTGGAVTAATALAAFPDRMGLSIQNQAIAPLFVKFGTGASTTVYDIVLKACTGAADGTGGAFLMDGGFCHTGIVTIAATGTPSYSATDW